MIILSQAKHANARSTHKQRAHSKTGDYIRASEVQKQQRITWGQHALNNCCALKPKNKQKKTQQPTFPPPSFKEGKGGKTGRPRDVCCHFSSGKQRRRKKQEERRGGTTNKQASKQTRSYEKRPSKKLSSMWMAARKKMHENTTVQKKPVKTLSTASLGSANSVCTRSSLGTGSSCNAASYCFHSASLNLSNGASNPSVWSAWPAGRMRGNSSHSLQQLSPRCQRPLRQPFHCRVR